MPEKYAATPPLEALRAVISCAVNSGLRQDGQSVSMKIMVADASRAYSYAKSIGPVYVKLVPEDFNAGEEHVRPFKGQHIRYKRRCP